jgi:AraC-like DNA-binding protein
MYAFRTLRLLPVDEAPLNTLVSGISYAIEEAVNPGYRHRNRKTTYLAILYTESGLSDYRINGQTVRIEPGSLLLMFPGISFYEQVPGPDPCHNIYLMLEGPLSTILTEKLHPENGFYYEKTPPKRLIRCLRECVERVHASRSPDLWRLGSDLLQLSREVVELYSGGPGQPLLIKQVEELIRADPAERWSVKQLARSTGMSESTFAHRFREECGCGPAAHVRHLRCTLAREWLQEGFLVSEVASRLGFANAFHFSRVFRKETGHPPSAFRRLNQFRVRPAR